MMCEVPSNAILAERFLEYFDGFSIGSNDLTQLTLGLDVTRPELLAQDFDERDPAVEALIHKVILACRAQGKYIGICGQAQRSPGLLPSGWRARAFPRSR